VSNIRAQVLIFFIFAAVNGSLFSFATYNFSYNDGNGPATLHPTFANAPDGHRYGGVAESLANGTGFHYLNDSTGELRPLVRGGPLPPIMFFAPVKFLEPNGSAAAIVSIQCALLYLTALILWRIASIFGIPPTLTQILCLFNPILIISAHHAQSEMIFTFLLALFLLTGISLISSSSTKLRSWGLLGFLAGCMYLARPAAIFPLIPMPAFFLALTYMVKAQREAWLRTTLGGAIIFVLVGLLTASPWLIRNTYLSTEDGIFLPLPNTGTSIHDNLIEMLFHGERVANWLHQIDLERNNSFLAISTELRKLETTAANCISSTPSGRHSMRLRGVGFIGPTDQRCQALIRKASIRTILEQDFGVWVRAGARAILVTLFSGGGNSLARYLGMDVLEKNGGALTNTRLMYLSILGLTIFVHILSISGLLLFLKNNPFNKHNWLLLITLFLFFASYGFIGNARFRVPLDPIFMLYTSYITGFLIEEYRRFRSKE
jgi:hypothetical protein